MYEINDGILPETISKSKYDYNSVSPQPVVIFHGNVFSSFQKKEESTFEYLLNNFITGKEYPFKKEFYEVRSKFLAEGKSNQYKKEKKKLPFFLPHVSEYNNYQITEGFRAHSNFRKLSNMLFLEIDFYNKKKPNIQEAVRKANELFALIQSGIFPLIYCAWISTSSSGIAIFIKCDLIHKNNFEYEIKRVADYLEREIQLRKNYKVGFDEEAMQLHQPCFLPIHEGRYIHSESEIWQTDPNPPPVKIKDSAGKLKTDPDLEKKFDDELYNFYLKEIFERGIYFKINVFDKITRQPVLYSDKLRYDFKRHFITDSSSFTSGEISLCNEHDEDYTVGILAKNKTEACIRFDISKDFKVEKSKACSTIQRIISEFYFISCLVKKFRKPMDKFDVYHMAHALNSKCYSSEKKYDPLSEKRLNHITCTIMEHIHNKSLWLILQESRTRVDYKNFLSRFSDEEKKNIGLLVRNECNRIRNKNKKENFLCQAKQELDKLYEEGRFESKIQLANILSPKLNLKPSTICSKLSRKEYTSSLLFHTLPPISTGKQNVAFDVAPNKSFKKIEKAVNKCFKRRLKVTKPLLNKLTGISERQIERLWKPLWIKIKEHNDILSGKQLPVEVQTLEAVQKGNKRPVEIKPGVQAVFAFPEIKMPVIEFKEDFESLFSNGPRETHQLKHIKLVIKDEAELFLELCKIHLEKNSSKISSKCTW